METENSQPGSRLLEIDLDPDPIVQFRHWLDQADAAGLLEPSAMSLATADANGKPSARMVLLRGYGPSGFIFYTNYDSRKGRELAANPQAALVFYWPELERQIRIEGRVEKVSAEVSDAYFQTRPLGSRLAAWASPQSEVIPNRDVLDRRVEELAAKYSNGKVPRPPHWGGYRVIPTAIEFWQGGGNRLHDRFRYRKSDQDQWIMERLGP